MYVDQSSPNWDGSNQPLGAGWYADGLIPFADPTTGNKISGAQITASPFSVNAGQNQPIWVDLQVPRGVTPGQYSGSYTVTSRQGSFTGQVEVSVWNFTLPLTPSLQTTFAFSQTQSLASNEELLRNRVSPISVDPAQEAQLMSNFGLGSSNLGFWSGADVSHCTMASPPSVNQIKSAIQSHQHSLSLWNFTADEIGNCPSLFGSIQQWGLALHQAGTKQLVTMAPDPALFDDGSGTGASAVDLWVMLPLMYTAADSNAIATVLKKGNSIWSANTGVQDPYSPKWELDFAPVNFRLQPGFISESLGFTGLLYWRVDKWTSDPWNNVNNEGVYSSDNFPGEGVLVYPGAPVGISGVAPSIRLKRIRDGVNDFEYVEMLKKAGQGAWALQIAGSVGPDWVNWTRDASAVESAHLQLGQELDRLSSQPLPGAPTNPNIPDKSSGISTSPSLSWAASANATSYDVYFGSSATPSKAATASVTSFSPNGLLSNTTYYWQVVAKNAAGIASSPLWSFTTKLQPTPFPASISVFPSSGSGSVGTFAFTYSDRLGYTELNGLNVLVGQTQSGVKACWIYASPTNNSVSLADDSGSQWATIQIGSSVVLKNSQCQITGSDIQLNGQGNNLVMNITIHFNSSYTGTKALNMNASDKAGLSSGYSAKGSWTAN
ncbi:MAG: DUF4091 domain-containing protein [Acidobacteriota bacterium]|nr:DUF4091 domain-containing protein [Acidobacteriota bacterium]